MTNLRHLTLALLLSGCSTLDRLVWNPIEEKWDLPPEQTMEDVLKVPTDLEQITEQLFPQENVEDRVWDSISAATEVRPRTPLGGGSLTVNTLATHCSCSVFSPNYITVVKVRWADDFPHLPPTPTPVPLPSGLWLLGLGIGLLTLRFR